jgi:hypothetical protein
MRNPQVKIMKFKLNSYAFLMAILVCMGGAISNAQAVLYPDMPVNAPTVGFDSFDISDWVSTNKPTSGVPEVSEWTRQNDPGDTMALSAEGIDGDVVSFDFYGEGMDGKGILTNGLIQRIDGRLAAVTLPDTLPENNFYLMWVQNEYGYGEPVGINKTDAWWCGPYYSSTGSVLSVFGENLDLGDGLSQLYIEGYGWVTNNGTYNPYKVDFTVPDALTNGIYTAYAHNGHGGKYGWSEQSVSFKVQASLESYFSEDTNTWFNVKDSSTWMGYTGSETGAVGDGVTDDTDALLACMDAAEQNGGITIYFPTGTYITKSSLYPSWPYIRIKGEGMDASRILAKDTWGGGSVLSTREYSIVEDIEINKGDIAATVYGVPGGGLREQVKCKNVRFSMLDTNSASPVVDNTANGVIPAYVDHVQFSGCKFILGAGVFGDDSHQLFFNDCDFYGVGDINGMMPFAGDEFSLNNCTAQPYDVMDSSTGLGWSKGRWIHGGGSIHNAYIGGNVTTNMAPRYATPFFREEPISISELTWDNPAETDEYDKASQTFTFTSLPEQQTSNTKVGIGPAGSERGDVDYFTPVWNTNDSTITINDYSLRLQEPDASNSEGLELIAWDGVDQNSGEQFLWENQFVYFKGYPSIVVSSNEIYFSDSSMADRELANGTFAICSGKGMGQSSKITSDSTIKGTVRLVTPLRVLPDSTSLCKIGSFLHRVVLYNNDLSGTEDTGKTSRNTATAGFSCYGGGSSSIVDGNTIRNVEEGILHWAITGPEGASSDIMEVSLFNVVKDTVIDGCQAGIVNIVSDYGHDIDAEPSFYGHIFRRNHIKNSSRCAFSDEIVTTQRKSLCVYDSNSTVSNVVSFLKVYGTDANIFDQVLIGNTFEQDRGTGLTLSQSESYVLRGNTWTGFDANYAGNFSEGILEVPVRLVELKSGVGNIEIWNSGTAKLEWSATTTSTWLTLTKSSGSIEDENSTDLLSFTMRTEPAVESQAVITVTAGEQSSVITLVYKGAGVMAVRSQTWPILFDSGGRALRAELYDVATEQTSYVYGLEVSKELQQPNPDREVKIRLQVQDGDQWINVENQGYK